jgi:hydroxymethylbilane synthase
MPDRVRVGTRASPLAVRQAELVAEALERQHPGLTVELVRIRTSGDRLGTANLAIVGGKGLFVKEIEEALLDGRVDLAVHSLKDLPAKIAGGLAVAAYPPREDPRDALVTRSGAGPSGLSPGARVGTSSPRRAAQLLERRPDLVAQRIRGNVETRLDKLRDGQYEAIVLACAGLIRLGLRPAGMTVLDADVMVPAVGQGVLAIEVREDDGAMGALVARVDHAPTRQAAEAERGFLEAVGGSCTTPLAAHARLETDGLRLRAFLGTPDGKRVVREEARGDPATAAELGRRLAARMLAAGGDDILRAAVAERDPGG